MFEYLHSYCIEFTVKPGKNVIEQSSVDSSVTIPFEQTYRDMSKLTTLLRSTTRFCGCGWPHNLLIPRGKPEGIPSELFVMISDYSIDKVKVKYFCL